MMHDAKHTPRGFSLLELVIVFVILALLAGIAIPHFAKRKERQYEDEARRQLTEVERAQREYVAANHRYAPDVATLGLPLSDRVTVTIGGTGLAAGTGWNATASHKEWESQKCFLGVGSDTIIGDVTTKSGEVKCR